MSGRKRTYVSVDEQELRRLQAQEARLRTVNQDLPERLEAVRRQVGQELRNRFAPVEARQREYERTVQGLQSALGSLERDAQRRLEQQRQEFASQIEAQHGELLGLLEKQDERFTSLLEDEGQARQQAVANLQGQINAIVADAGRKQRIATTFVSDLTTIIVETNRMPHQRFAPGGMDKVLRAATDARSSLAAGMAEAALSTAQDAYWELADLRVIVLAKEREFMLVHQTALAGTRALLEEARANRLQRLEREGEEKAHELEVDYWTNGELSTLEVEVKALEARLESGWETLSIDEARRILSGIEARKPRVAEIVTRAEQNILASQLRADIAGLVVATLEEQGFDVMDAAYVGEDMRNAYVVKVTNIAGSEVVTVISPVGDEPGKNEVTIHSFDATYRDDQVRHQRAQEIAAALRGEGLEVGSPQEVGDAAPEFRDMNAVRRPKAAERTMERTGVAAGSSATSRAQGDNG